MFHCKHFLFFSICLVVLKNTNCQNWLRLMKLFKIELSKLKWAKRWNGLFRAKSMERLDCLIMALYCHITIVFVIMWCVFVICAFIMILCALVLMQWAFVIMLCAFVITWYAFVVMWCAFIITWCVFVMMFNVCNKYKWIR